MFQCSRATVGERLAIAVCNGVPSVPVFQRKKIREYTTLIAMVVQVFQCSRARRGERLAIAVCIGGPSVPVFQGVGE